LYGSCRERRYLIIWPLPLFQKTDYPPIAIDILPEPRAVAARDHLRVKQKKNAFGELTVGSLFSGCGGFDIGFEQEGFLPIGAFDIDSHVVAAYNENIAPVASVCDLSRETPQIKPDVLIAGSPCQGFSTAGKRDLDDPRNNLLIRAGQIAVALKPKVFVLENVPAAISGKHGSRWELVECMLKDAGYHVARIIAEGPTSGVPQLRKRLFLLSWLGNKTFRCEPEIKIAPALDKALANVDGISGHDPIFMVGGSREKKIAGRIDPGQKLCNVRISPAAVPTWDIPEVFGRVSASEREVLETIQRLRRRDRRRDFGDADPVLQSAVSASLGRSSGLNIRRLLQASYLRRVGHFIDLKHTYNGKYRRLSLTGVSPTVDTHFGDPSLFLHPTGDRGLTPREAARIQGFADTFKITTTRNRAFRMIGNAVPPPMASRLAKFIRETIFEVRD
jgi:DNA (cytosine-5)-methyltransferase 1